MSVQTLEPVLQDHPFVEGLAPDYVRLLSGCARNVRFRAGEYIWREGEQADVFYLLREGEVALELYLPHKGAMRIETVDEGEVLGWSWMLAPYRWHFDARAITDVRALEFDARCVRNKAQEDNSFGYQVLMRFSKIMQERLEATRMRLLDLYGK